MKFALLFFGCTFHIPKSYVLICSYKSFINFKWVIRNKTVLQVVKISFYRNKKISSLVLLNYRGRRIDELNPTGKSQTFSKFILQTSNANISLQHDTLLSYYTYFLCYSCITWEVFQTLPHNPYDNAPFRWRYGRELLFSNFKFNAFNK